MKVSIAASILILLVAALFGVPNHQRLTVMRESHAKLVATAAQIGVSIDPSHPDDPVRVTKRERENKDADAKLAAAELIAFAKEMEAIEQTGGPPDETQQNRVLEIMDRMMSLDAAQLKILIAEVRAAKELKDDTRQEIIGFSIMTFSNDHPQAALALFTESSDLLTERVISDQVVSSTLAKWAEDDPLATMEWVKKNGAKFPDLITDDAKRGLISSIAAQDPKLAFKLIGDLEIKDTRQALSMISVAATTPELRTATLSALREHLATLSDEKVKTELSDSAVRWFANNVVETGFEAGTKWVAESNLSPAELQSFAEGLSELGKNEESGQWIEWIGEKLPAKKASDRINRLVRTWTRNDYQAAGKWLTTAADGPTKNSAIRGYAETVAKVEPVTAAQWAMTLPPGTDRDKTLKNIYNNWPQDDSAAKEAFKQEHGIK
jgi:hypothetical protein